MFRKRPVNPDPQSIHGEFLTMIPYMPGSLLICAYDALQRPQSRLTVSYEEFEEMIGVYHSLHQRENGR
ncbi:MAG: hypothetical protein IMW91_02165 [Firmicutes bacterium]|nr:hypothetical protein [Bacillota bacterium]